MNFNVIDAIFRRNFVSYFSNPTGYVFITVFVVLCMVAGFWPNEFFASNLCNLDQLNKWIPYILLAFVPAVTMSIWAEERRQGTDELLLTIPAKDSEVVLGKYLAILGIFSVALAYAMFCCWIELQFLGVPTNRLNIFAGPDLGLFLATFFGYWLLGAAMLSVGMVASFLTGNLTVSFILGAVFNAPLVFLEYADSILPQDFARWVTNWSFHSQFRDFGRGVVSLSAIAYFVSVIAVMLYLSIVLIGRRHWMGGRDGTSMAGHYFGRAIGLAAGAVCLVCLVVNIPSSWTRRDVTAERLTALSPETITLLGNLESDHAVRIEAYVSPEVPESYVQTRLNLLSALREIETHSGGKVSVKIISTEPLSEEADVAEQKFGIKPREVTSRSRGAVSQDRIYLGFAAMSGLAQLTIPFVDRGVPIEYELIRSIATVGQPTGDDGEPIGKKKLGVLATDAKLMGGFNPSNPMQPEREEAIIEELKKQYKVVTVTIPSAPDQPFTPDCDVLLAVQPSGLDPEQMGTFIDLVKSGMPTAIFEDPFPSMIPGVTPTADRDKQPQQRNPFSPSPPPSPKGDISPLWDLLGIEFDAENVVWQDYNPYTEYRRLMPPEIVFVDDDSSTKSVFNESATVVSGLQQLVFAFPGSFSAQNASKLKFEELITTGERTGTIRYTNIYERDFMGNPIGYKEDRDKDRAHEGSHFVLAAELTGEAVENMPMADDKPKGGPAKSNAKDEEKKQEAKVAKPIHAIVVSDIDILSGLFMQLRAQGQDPDAGFTLNVDNVTFILNILDKLSGDERFIDIRKRRAKHRGLATIENDLADARQAASDSLDKAQDELTKAKAEEQSRLDKIVEAVRQDSNLDELTKEIEIGKAQESGNRRLAVRNQQAQQRFDIEKKRIDRGLAEATSARQNIYKAMGVLVPPIAPLLLGLFVLFSRRAREREGVARSRLR